MKQALICCAIAFVITAAIGPSVIRYLRKMKFGQKILEIGPKWHMNKQNIPTMGGFMFIIGIGIAVFKFSRLGNDSISALNLRLAELVGLPFSIENVLMNLCLFVPQLLWGRRYIGLGTIINSFCIGFIVTFTGDAMTAVFGSADTLPVQLLWVAVAVLVIALGCSLYQTADLGVAPYDALSLMLADWLPVPYFGCRVFTDALCALLCWLLGGLVGIGTLICAFCLGPFIQFFNGLVSERVLHYKPGGQ